MNDSAQTALDEFKQLTADSGSFPRYLLKIGDEYALLPLKEAGITYDAGWVQVSLEKFVLEEDLSMRLITPEEEQKIGDIADAYSGSK